MDGRAICEKLEELQSAGAGFESLLEECVRLVHESNTHFHWTGIYELARDQVLRLGPFIGTATEHVIIRIGEGVCGSAVAEKQNKNVPDVAKEPNYLACSTATRSELVVLIQKGGEIFAQIDIDSHDKDAFDPQTVETVQQVADWLADIYAARNVSR